MSDYITGFKFLDPTGATYYEGKRFQYNLPHRGERFAVTVCPDAIMEPDGEDCGPGGLHLMKYLDARYAPNIWWPWHARGYHVLGQGTEKARVTEIWLRPIAPKMFHRLLRSGFGAAHDLYGADLSGADLSGADLSVADLSRANLYGADLSGADLSGAVSVV